MFSQLLEVARWRDRIIFMQLKSLMVKLISKMQKPATA